MNDTTVPNTSQPTPKPGDQATSSQTQLSEQELDRLHVRWILGKNRGLDTPLNKIQLNELLRTKRLALSQLSSEEKNQTNSEFAAPTLIHEDSSLENLQIRQLEQSINNLTQEDILQRNKYNSLSVEDQVNLFMHGIRKATETILLNQLHYCPREEWAQKDDKTKTSILKLFQYTFFEVNEQELRKSLRNIFTERAE